MTKLPIGGGYKLKQLSFDGKLRESCFSLTVKFVR